MAEYDIGEMHKFGRKVREAMTELVVSSVEDLAHDANKRIRHDTRYLKASMRTTHSQGANFDAPMATKRRPSRAEKLAEGGRGHPAIRQALANFDPMKGGWIKLTWTAFYARFVEQGTKRMRARPFAGPAAKQWPRIVAENAKRVRALIERM